jgi:cobalt-precorrin 5A hydrolase
VQSIVGGKIMCYSHEAIKAAMDSYKVIIALMSVGIVVRGLAPFITDKWFDPAVVVVDEASHYAVPLLGGHHGANDIALQLFNSGIVRHPVITTATDASGAMNVESVAEALNCAVVNRKATKSINTKFLSEQVEVARVEGPKIVIVDEKVAVLSKTSGKALSLGIGARKGVSKDMVCDAIFHALDKIQATLEDVKTLATADIKAHEEGIFSAAGELEKPIALVPSSIINKTRVISRSRAEKIGLVGVAEPSALALSNLHELVLTKTTYGGVTIAIAR